jgi:GT2 family glycosyltransferase
MAPSVLISVLNWRDPGETAACVGALLAMDYPNARVLVVNNGEAAGLRGALAPMAERVTVIQNPVNLGFAGGHNVAIRQALEDGSDYVWLFNSDAEPAPTCLSRLVAAMEQDPGCGIASPVIYHHDDRSLVWSAGGWFDLATASYGRFSTAADAARFAAEHPDRYMLTGTAFLIRTAAARAIGGLDEALFAYHEDTDYCIRAEQAGFRRCLVTEAAIYHRHSPAPFPSVHGCYYMARNEVLLWRKHAGWLAALRSRFWGVRRAMAALDRYRERPDLQRAAVAGWWHGQIGVTGPWNRDRSAPAAVPALLRCGLLRRVAGVG